MTDKYSIATGRGRHWINGPLGALGLSECCALLNAFHDRINKLEAQTKEEWISVKDRLPETPKNVLIATLEMAEDESFVQIGHYAFGRWYQGANRVFDATHWQPLPKPPSSIPEIPDS